jgi:hypothetical protein
MLVPEPLQAIRRDVVFDRCRLHVRTGSMIATFRLLRRVMR